MKKKIRFGKSFGKKNIILSAVALILATMTAVTATASWIEEVSQVEFSSTDGQETPLHVGDKVLKSDAVIKSNPATDVINLSDYFNESGDIHLSPCYGDGENFYFPVQQTTDGDTFRVGTKDDANVNYLSATFRVRSEGANTAYWFEKTNTNTDFIKFKDSNGDTVTSFNYNNQNYELRKYLRISLTVDGATNVYAYNDDGSFYTVSDSSAVSATGRQLDKFIYYPEENNDSAPAGYYKNAVNVTGKPNQGNGDNLNGNTLFTVNTYNADNKSTVKEVTVKLWLEYNDGFDSGIDVRVSDINLNIVSSWAKSRRIYVRDATVYQDGYSQAKWLTHNGTSDNTAKLYWAVRDDITNENKRFELMRVSSSSEYYYVDVPAVYNNTDVVLLRCQNGWNTGSVNYTGGSATVKCWDSWETAFPDTFHSEVFTVYSKEFGSWNDDVHSIYYINSSFALNTSSTDPYDYMWDHNSEHGTDINAKVVKNANWPGIKMTTKLNSNVFKSGSYTFGIPTYAFHFNSDYDRIIFNDGHLESGKNNEYQTQDLWITSSQYNQTFDMSTLTWFSTYPGDANWKNKIPTYSADNTFLYSNFSTDNRWRRTRFAWGGEYASVNQGMFNGTSSTNMMCRVYAKAADDYEFIAYYGGTAYKTEKDNVNLYSGNTITLRPDGSVADGKTYDKNVYAKDLTAKKIYRFYLTVHNGYIDITMLQDNT